MTTDLNLQLNQLIELNDGRIGTIRFLGTTNFAPGDWVGVEFEDARYFDCEAGHGLLTKPVWVTRILEEPNLAPKPSTTATTATSRVGSRPSSEAAVGRTNGVRRQSTLDRGGRSQSVNAGSPTPGARISTELSGLSGLRSPTKQIRSTGPPMPETSRPQLSLSAASATNLRRPTMAPPPLPTSANRLARPSISGPTLNNNKALPSSDFASKSSSSRLSMAQRSGAHGTGSVNHVRPTGLSSSRRTSSLSTMPRNTLSRTNTAHTKEMDELQAKFRILEKKRGEDREKLKVLEKLQQERDRFESIIQRLQPKLQTQHQEIGDLKRQLKESESKLVGIEDIQAEHDSVVEMATLDREMAEETAEVLKTELDALKQTVEELQLEVEVLREENQELSHDMSPEERTSQGWLQMERTNERLKEALLRLRDTTQEQEAELKVRIKGLEVDVQALRGVKEQLEDSKVKLLHSESDIEDLRQQLDAALGAEEMIEELTERNLALQEQMDELRNYIEDLESLRELGDELEINHAETEKQMQAEIDDKDSAIAEHVRRSARQEATLGDYEYTLTRFRELVTSMQSDLEDMRASQQITETESEELTNRSRAMMDLNMKLQVSASKTQVKTVDLELQRLEAQEASEHLAIVQLFLPEAFHTERDSVLALLRFKRIGFKAHLLHGLVKERTLGQGPRGLEEEVFAACDVLDKLTWISAICSMEQFAKFEGALHELEPALKTGDVKAKQVADELQRSMALMTHLASIHIQEDHSSYADEVLMRTLLIQSHLENTAAALALTKAMVQSKVQPSLEKGEGNGNEVERFAQKADSMITHSRSAKVIVGKAIRALEELKTRSLSLTLDTSSSFAQCESAAMELAAYTRQLEGRQGAVTYIFANTAPESEVLSVFDRRLHTVTEALVNLGSLASDLENTVEFERQPAPWVVRSKELKSTRITSVDTEEELKRITSLAQARGIDLKLRDQELEEQQVKIELLEARTQDSKKAIDLARSREQQLAGSLEAQTRDLKALENDRNEWKRLAHERKTDGAAAAGLKEGMERAVATAREMELLKSEIKSLQGAVRFLRDDNQRARLTQPASSNAMAWLEEPLIKKSSRTQEQRDEVVAEGKDVLSELLHMVETAKTVDLTALPQNKLQWRPAKSTSRFQVAQQREQWAQWVEWRDSVIQKGEALRPKDAKVRAGAKKVTGNVAAKVQFRLPGSEAKVLPFRDVAIVDPGAFEEFRDGLGFA
ncbi:dynein associated protein-domain-containing protein [Cryomyces antarcticus]